MLVYFGSWYSQTIQEFNIDNFMHMKNLKQAHNWKVTFWCTNSWNLYAYIAQLLWSSQGSAESVWSPSPNVELEKENEELRNQVAALEDRVERLRDSLSDRDDAEMELSQYFLIIPTWCHNFRNFIHESCLHCNAMYGFMQMSLGPSTSVGWLNYMGQLRITCVCNGVKDESVPDWILNL